MLWSFDLQLDEAGWAGAICEVDEEHPLQQIGGLWDSHFKQLHIRVIIKYWELDGLEISCVSKNCNNKKNQ